MIEKTLTLHAEYKTLESADYFLDGLAPCAKTLPENIIHRVIEPIKSLLVKLHQTYGFLMIGSQLGDPVIAQCINIFEILLI